MKRTTAWVPCVLLVAMAACRQRGADPGPRGDAGGTPVFDSEPISITTSRPSASSEQATPAASSPAVAQPVELGRPPLLGFFEALPVPGHPDAWLSLPTGATSKRPVVVVIHGAGDRPDWQCGGWRHATQGYPFVLCLRGFVDQASSRWNDVRYTHMGGAPLLQHIDAGLDALAARYPEYVDTSAPLFAGFSLGAAEIVVLAARDPSRFARIALVEGGTNAWSRSRIDAFRNGGGLRVLFGCGQEGVHNAAKLAANRLLAAGIDARVVFASVGHTFDPPLEDALAQELPWWVEGDVRWPVASFDGGER